MLDFLNEMNCQVSLQIDKKRCVFRAGVNVLQSVLFVYRQVSAAGNARLFAVVDIECKAVPLSVVSWDKWPLLGSTLYVHS